jgi:hypothetical protein
MAEGNFSAGWDEIPSYTQEYRNFINSRDIIYVYVMAAFVNVVIFILIPVQYTGHSLIAVQDNGQSYSRTVHRSQSYNCAVHRSAL